MTSEDDTSISENDLDEIVDRVVDRLRDAGLAGDDETDLEVRDEEDDGTEGVEDDENGGPADDENGGPADDEGNYGPEDDSTDESGVHHDHDEFGEQRGDAGNDNHGARHDWRQRGDDRFEDLGERIEAAVEARLDHVQDRLEHSTGQGAPDAATGSAEPNVVIGSGPMPAVRIGPGDNREKAVYKTQLQKGGRVAVPDTEIEALGLEPGDTLQVVLYPVE